MSFLHTYQSEWRVMNQASLTVADGTILSSAGATLTANAYVMAYGITWANAAQNPAKWPKAVAMGPVTATTNYLRVRFLVSDAANEECAATIWGREGNGAPFDLLVMNPIVAGTSVCTTHPVTGATLTNFLYADTINVTSDHCGYNKWGTDTANGIIEIEFDTRGFSFFFCDFDCNGAGTASADAICLYKTY